MGKDSIVKYNINKSKLFQTTIAISAVYGVVATGLLAFTLFTGDSSDSLAGSFKPFIMTLMGGMVFTLLVLVVQIATFAPTSVDISADSGFVCPDYWSLKKTPVDDPDYVAAGNDVKASMSYRCVPNKSVYSMDTTDGTTAVAAGGTNTLGQTYLDASGVYGFPNLAPDTNTASPQSKLVAAAMNMYNGKYFTTTNGVAGTPGTAGGSVVAGTNNHNLRCDKLYPGYLAKMDVQGFPETPNLLRCKYASTCRIPWTGVCPSNS